MLMTKEDARLSGVRCLVIYSGGLDSTVLLCALKNYYGAKVHALHFNYGSRQNGPETMAVENICHKQGIPLHYIELPFIQECFKSSLLQGGEPIPEGHYQSENMKSTVVPFRNGIMSAIAAGYAESHDFKIIALGVHSGDHAIYPDCRPEFVALMGTAIWQGCNKNIKLFAPFLEMDKAQIVNFGEQVKTPFIDTYTCYKGGDLHCGRCGACVERKEAFNISKIPDPTSYLK